MTIREINRTISTANYATYTISELGGGNIKYKELHCSEIPARMKDAEIFVATPTNISFSSVKHWNIVLL